MNTDSCSPPPALSEAERGLRVFLFTINIEDPDPSGINYKGREATKPHFDIGRSLFDIRYSNALASLLPFYFCLFT